MSFLDCTVIGDVFLDVVVRVSGDHERFFSGGTSYCDFARVVPGGSGNIAVGLSTLGGRAAFVGKAGDDVLGKFYVQDLRERRVISKVFLDRYSPTGLIVVLVEEGRERSFLVFRGANDRLSIDEIRSVVDLLRRSRFVYFSGYSLVNNPQRSAILRTVEIARKSKSKIVFDPGAHNIVKSEKNLFSNLLDLCDVFSTNLDEAMAITNTNHIEDIVNILREKVPLTALKCGKDGAILISKENTVRVPSYNVKCLDPTGAGDAFTAALIYGLTRRMPLESIGRLANWFASRVITNIGSRSFPSRLETKRFIKLLCAKSISCY